MEVWEEDPVDGEARTVAHHDGRLIELLDETERVHYHLSRYLSRADHFDERHDLSRAAKISEFDETSVKREEADHLKKCTPSILWADLVAEAI